jgi:hypothetical protein
MDPNSAKDESFSASGYLILGRVLGQLYSKFEAVLVRDAEASKRVMANSVCH